MKRSALVVVAVAATAVLVPTPASANGLGNADADCQGSGCSVRVTYSGTAAPSGGGGGGYVASVPPTCWYEAWADPQAALKEMRDFYALPGFSGKEFILTYGSMEEFEKAADAQKKGDGATPTWYKLHCRSSDLLTSPEAIDFAGESVALGGYGQYARQTRLVASGQTPPPPLVDVETLRDAALASMDIPEPAIERNPEISGSAATLVNLDTYFWAGGYDDVWDITASVGPISATVVARTEGWTLTSPAGGTTCTHQQFATAYAPGADNCAIAFDRASLGYPGGYPVRASATWQTSWTGVPAPSAPAPLQPLTTGTTVNVPVAESQAVVEKVG